MNKKTYLKPTMRVVAICQQCCMIPSSLSSPKPSASFMSNPGIGEDDE